MLCKKRYNYFFFLQLLEDPLIINFHVDRIGLSLVANAPLDVEVDAKTDAAVGIARAFSFISSDKDTRQAFDWLIKVSSSMHLV